MNEADAHTWSSELSKVISELSRFTPEQFLAVRDGRNSNSASKTLDTLCVSLETDRADWKQFMRANPRPRQNWLPIEPSELDSMDVHEIYYRLRENAADERWMDDALLEAFESGSLLRALEKIEANISSFELIER